MQMSAHPHMWRKRGVLKIESLFENLFQQVYFHFKWTKIGHFDRSAQKSNCDIKQICKWGALQRLLKTFPTRNVILLPSFEHPENLNVVSVMWQR